MWLSRGSTLLTLICLFLCIVAAAGPLRPEFQNLSHEFQLMLDPDFGARVKEMMKSHDGQTLRLSEAQSRELELLENSTTAIVKTLQRMTRSLFQDPRLRGLERDPQTGAILLSQLAQKGFDVQGALVPALVYRDVISRWPIRPMVHMRGNPPAGLNLANLAKAQFAAVRFGLSNFDPAAADAETAIVVDRFFKLERLLADTLYLAQFLFEQSKVDGRKVDLPGRPAHRLDICPAHIAPATDWNHWEFLECLNREISARGLDISVEPTGCHNVCTTCERDLMTSRGHSFGDYGNYDLKTAQGRRKAIQALLDRVEKDLQ